MNTRSRWLDTGPSETEETQPEAGPGLRRPPCADQPDTWDLDTGTPDAWHLAVRICMECPLLNNCQDLVETLAERGDGPRAMIWAGVGYDNSGRVIENLDRYRSTPSEARRPLRIIRTGGDPIHAETALAAPARRIILGRQLPRSGSEAC